MAAQREAPGLKSRASRRPHRPDPASAPPKSRCIDETPRPRAATPTAALKPLPAKALRPMNRCPAAARRGRARRFSSLPRCPATARTAVSWG
ncbi:hypothetical protein LC55x_3021 [Lysobacter capsici]|nr:hypothetical protein LC55x_3021 [Lysobacter capsici]